MDVKVGITEVKHKHDAKLGTGKIIKVALSGKRVKVKWPPSKHLPFGHTAYYPLESLEFTS